MDQKELIEEIENFLNETGNWFEFVAYIQAKGYSEEDLEKVIDESKEK